MKTYLIDISGLVQGVGFRPFVYRIAKEIGIKGNISNNNHGVKIIINAQEREKENFISRIIKEKPVCASITSIEINELNKHVSFDNFNITESQSLDNNITTISPDLAVCSECLQDMKNDQSRRDYPFINCTNCGPRFSIINGIPYDRISTSMKCFVMCEKCRTEYHLTDNRRFHAQPIACNFCGPKLQIFEFNENTTLERQNGSNREAIEKAAQWINSGNVLSLKGLGGYNLICDPFNEDAVKKLRSIKERSHKPFAVMFRSIDIIKKYAHVSDYENAALISPVAPIVLLELKDDSAININKPLKTVGAILPYLPLHYLLFEKINADAIVFTSGNFKEEPIITDNVRARSVLLPKTGLQIDNDREIVNRVDDSLLQVINKKTRILRRSRGYVPKPLNIGINTDGILALGGELNNTFSLGKGYQIIQSQYIGDLKNIETYDFYEQALERYFNLFRFYPSMIVCDKHPDYLSSLKGREMSEKMNIPLMSVQHHHAHAASVMVENNLSKPTLAVVMDGTGYGTDGNIWGSEFIICSPRSFERISHFDYIPLPGGDMAIKEPWRCCVSFLKKFNLEIPDYLYKHIGDKRLGIISKMIDYGINSPLSCGAGRLFDAVSALLGICFEKDYDSRAAIELEHSCSENVLYSYPIDKENALNLKNVFESMLDDIKNGTSRDIIAAMFHNTIIDMIVSETRKIINSNGLSNEVILSGGCFQNKYLTSRLEKKLSSYGIISVSSYSIPVNDESISVGQLFIAANVRDSNYA